MAGYREDADKASLATIRRASPPFAHRSKEPGMSITVWIVLGLGAAPLSRRQAYL